MLYARMQKEYEKKNIALRHSVLCFTAQFATLRVQRRTSSIRVGTKRTTTAFTVKQYPLCHYVFIKSIKYHNFKKNFSSNKHSTATITARHPPTPDLTKTLPTAN